MPRALAIAILMTTSLCPALAGQRLPREDVVEDIRFFLRTLEETHPDPYSAFRGKMAFKLRAQELLRRVPAEGLTADELRVLIAPFLGTLGDAHTSLRPPAGDRGGTPRSLPIVFRVAADATYIAAATAPYEHLIGTRLTTVQEVPLAELQELARGILPSENEYGAARAAARALRSTRYTAQLFGQELDTLRIRGIDRAGDAVESRISFLPTDAVELARPAQPWPDLEGDNGAIWWRSFDSLGVGYLRLESIEGREAFEEARDRQDLPGYVARYYDRYLHRRPPTSIVSAVAGVPCFTESVTELLTTMRAQGSEYLVVDLRENGGGWSSLMLPLYLFAYGDEYLDHDFPEVWVDVASPQLLALNGWGAVELRAAWGESYEIGDYRRRAPGPSRAGRTDAEYVADLEEFRCGLAERFLALQGRPLHRPTVIVLVDTGTFSAAFQAAHHLQDLGAVLVGVPPSQAGNVFTNVIPVELPNSRLRGSIARSAQIYYPDDAAGGLVMRLDFPMTWDVYARYGFDAHSELRYALDLIAGGRVRGKAER